MKIIYFLPILLMACQIKKTMNNTEDPFLEGKINSEEFNQVPYNNWYTENYKNYTVQTEVLNKLNEVPNWKHTTQVKIYMGTWCSDSQEQVSALLKIFDYLKFESYTIIGLDRDKKSKKGFEEGENIIKVPTIIFIQNRSEVNRIIETPVNSLEQDMVDILVMKEYTPHSFE